MIRHWRRWLTLVVLIVGLVAGFRYVLCSRFIAARVAAKLGELYGGRLLVGGANVGLHQTILRDVALFEPGEQTQPWLKIDRLEADISLREVLAGATPARVVLQGVTVTLRFDADGRMLTQLPPRKPGATAPLSELPEIDLTDGKVLLVGTDGRRLDFDDVAMTLKPQGHRHILDGRGHAVALGDLIANGWIDIADSQVSLSAHSAGDIAVTPPLLESLPVVPASTWHEVRADGLTPVALTWTCDWAKADQTYRVDLQPSKAKIYVAAIDLTATDVTGNLQICESKVQLHGFKGQACGGALAVDGLLDFSNPGVHVALTNIDIDNADVRQLPSEWSLPPQLAGRLHAACTLDLIAGTGKLQTRATGSGSVQQASIAGQPTTGPIDLAFRDVGDATHLAVQLGLPPSPLSKLTDAFGATLPADTAAQVSLNLSALLPLNTINDPTSYHADARLAFTDGRVVGWKLEPLTAVLHCADGELKCDPFTALLKDVGSFTTSGTLSLKDPFAYRAHVEAPAIDLATLRQLEPVFRPELTVTGQLEASADVVGTLRRAVPTTSGTATIKNLQADAWSIQAAHFHWRSDAERIIVDSLKVEAYSGTLQGTAELPLTPGHAWFAQLELQGLDVAKLAISQTKSVKLAGRVDGKLRATLTPQNGDRLRQLEVAIDMRSPQLVLDRIAATQVVASLALRQGILAYDLEGKTLGGQFGVKGEAALEPAALAKLKDGRLWMRQIDLTRVSAMEGAGPLAGTIDGELTLHQNADDIWPVAKGRLTIADLGWKDEPIAAQVQGDLNLTRQKLTFNNISATLGQGTTNGKLVVYLDEPERSYFTLDLAGAELTDLLHPWPGLAANAQGTVDLRLRGKFGKEWTGTADVVLQRAKVLGVDVTEWRAPVSWSFRPGEGRAEVLVRDSNAHIAQGRATAQAALNWDSGLRLTGQIQFVDVDMRQAFPGAKVGNGRATGKIDFGSDRLQTADDLRATLVATMHHAQALEFPILRQVAPLLGLAPTKTFQNGEIRARLANGVVHIEKLALAEGPLQLYAEGNVTLQGNVNLDMTANTGKIGNIVAALGWRLPQTGTIAADMLTRAATALSPTLVHIHIRGTVREPTIQVIPLPVLTERALRFFAGS